MKFFRENLEVNLYQYVIYPFTRSSREQYVTHAVPCTTAMYDRHRRPHSRSGNDKSKRQFVLHHQRHWYHDHDRHRQKRVYLRVSTALCHRRIPHVRTVQLTHQLQRTTDPDHHTTRLTVQARMTIEHKNQKDLTLKCLSQD